MPKKRTTLAPQSATTQIPPSTLSVSGIKAISWLILAGITGYFIVSLFRPQWNNLLAVVYPTPTPLVLPFEDDSPEAVVILEPAAPEATLSATFINDLIQAILDASSSADASAEVTEILETRL